MTDLRKEIVENFAKFEEEWPKELKKAKSRLASTRVVLEESYVRISTIQAWRNLLAPKMDEETSAFLFEAQNDFLTSHCLASCGAFRQALKALRSALENVLLALYYKDHPIELQKWLEGSHRMSYADLHAYFDTHPYLKGASSLAGLDVLRSEYSTLSKAVHGSAKQFRMTDSSLAVRLWSDDVASVSKWATREREVIISLNLLFAHMFRTELAGAKNLSLRTSMGLILSSSRCAQLKTKLGITVVN